MKQARIISAGGCLAALLVAGCSGMSSNSTTNSLGGLAPKGAIGISSSPLVRPFCGERFYVTPKHATIKVHQLLYLHNHRHYFVYPYGCARESVDALWTASGGVIWPRHGGKEAVFSAVAPGAYQVDATWQYDYASARVTVTLP